jgi:hypothetical protein
MRGLVRSYATLAYKRGFTATFGVLQIVTFSVTDILSIFAPAYNNVFKVKEVIGRALSLKAADNNPCRHV